MKFEPQGSEGSENKKYGEDQNSEKNDNVKRNMGGEVL